jgi:DNA polymerase III subunit epsilon
MYLFLDTETTGIPRRYDAPPSDLRNWPRMVQVAWAIFDPQGNAVAEHEHVIRPDGFTIPPDVVRVHGITTEKALAKGVALATALRELAGDLERAEVAVAHNFSFDEGILGAEFIRAGIKHRLHDVPHICTMVSTADFCGIPGRRGCKWPTLGELYFTLFGRWLSHAHFAPDDVRACAKCFFELRKRGMYA